MIIKFSKLPTVSAKKADHFEKSNMLKAWCMKNIKLWLWKYWRTLKTFWQRICFCKRMLLFFTFQLFILSYAYKRNLAWHSFFCYTYILYTLFFFLYFMKNCDGKHFFWVNIKTVFFIFYKHTQHCSEQTNVFIFTNQRPWNGFKFRAATIAQNWYLNLFW